MALRNTINRLLGKALKRVVIFRSNEFKLTALDVLSKTANLRGQESPFGVYLDWRHDQIRTLGPGLYMDNADLTSIFDTYYGKVDRISLVVSFLQATLSIRGDVAEFGVFKGHSALAIDRFLGEAAAQKQLFLFDSFAGMPDVTHALDSYWEKGDLSVTEAEVRDLFGSNPRIEIVPGFFSETLPKNQDLTFSFCHVDADLYTSIMECIEYILPRLTPGGIIVFDDYGFRAAAGAKAAIIEGLGPQITNLIPLPTGQAVYLSQYESISAAESSPISESGPLASSIES